MISRELPVRIYSAAQCKALDRRAINTLGISGYALMQRAAHSALALLRSLWPEVRSLSVWAGGGNNGGDAVVLARLAHELGWQVQVIIANSKTRLNASGEAAAAWAELPAPVKVETFNKALQIQGELIVDGLLGIGLKGEVRPPVSEMIEMVNRSGLPVLSLDQPSGLDADTGSLLGCAVKADATLSFIANKLGWLTGQGPAFSGRRYWSSLGLPETVFEGMEPFAYLSSKTQLQDLLPRRPATAHKGMYGNLCIIGGNRGMGGSIIMAAEAALRAGAGRVVLLTQPEHIAASLARVPEVMVHGVNDPNDCLPLLQGCNALVVGPGLGQDAWAKALLGLAESFDGPRVYDADALNLMAAGQLRAGENAVCTPHPGEAGRMLGLSVKQIQQDRIAAVLNLERKFGGVQVLKGAGTLTAYRGRIEVCDRGNPGMATAGMGDILSGIIGALIAQGLSPSDAAACGVYIHARAGDLAAAQGERGLLASDLLRQIRRVVNHNEIED